MVLGRETIWLPERWRSRELGELTTGKALPFIIRRVRWFERFARPRWARLLRQRWFLRVLGIVIIVFTVGAALAPPFSGLDTLPALGVVLIALAIILEDGAFVVAGAVVGLAGLALIVTVGSAVASAFRRLF
jgi:hypothetical protein